MHQRPFIKLLKIVFVLASFISLNHTFAKDNNFDIEYAITVESASGLASPPISTLIPEFDYWRGSHHITFNNGLITFWVFDFDRKEQAEEYVKHAKYEISKTYNVVPYSNTANEFYLVDQDGYSMMLKFEIDYEALNNPYKYPKITNISYSEEIVSYWFSQETKYKYTIELSDGSIWVTTPLSSLLNDFWAIEARIIKIGNNKTPCLINVEAVQNDGEILYYILKGHYITDLELLSDSKD